MTKFSYHFDDDNVTTTATLFDEEENAVSLSLPIRITLVICIWLFAIGMCVFQLKAVESQNESQRLRLEREEEIAKEEKKFDPDTRRKAIASHILTTKVSKGKKGRIAFCTPIVDENEKLPSNQNASTTDVISDNVLKSNENPLCIEVCYSNEDEYLELPCSICLDNFELGQDLSWSRQLKCQHLFHNECLVPWLMKHDDCPVCREVLILSSDDESERINDGNNHSTNEEEEESLGSSSGMFSIVNGLVSFVHNTHQSIVCPDDEQNAEDISQDVENIPALDTDKPEDVQDVHSSHPNKRRKKTKIRKKKSNVRYEAIDSDGNNLTEEMQMNNTNLV